MKTTRLLTLFVLAAMQAMLLVSCVEKEKQKVSKEGTPCQIIVAKQTTLDSKWYYVGEIEATSVTSAGFRIPGTIKTVYVREGDRVSKGQLLAEIDDKDVVHSYNMSKATLAQAEDAMKRVQMMHDEQSISDLKYVDVLTKLDQAREMYISAKQRMEDTKLYAPVAGAIGRRSIEPGENYAPVSSAFSIFDLHEMIVNIPVPEREIPNIKRGDRAIIKVLALGDEGPFTAKVDEIGVASNPITHSYNVRFKLPNPQQKLMDGMVCNVQLWPDSNQQQTGIVLPVHAVLSNMDNVHYVWVVEGGKAKRRKVTVGSFIENGVVVTGGLNEGDHVITRGNNKVTEGETVKGQK
ncbi:MAG: efflux RND transporter periplasmic adaptor subunit [Prevotellaceae bacterium]|nr:efflux RND transporter periplasmic adaptor subunit [Prevotellaceae bacterium]